MAMPIDRIGLFLHVAFPFLELTCEQSGGAMLKTVATKVRIGLEKTEADGDRV